MAENGVIFAIANPEPEILPDEALAKLGEKYCYTYQQRMDAGHSAVRFCTSWATKKSAVEALCADLREILA